MKPTGGKKNRKYGRNEKKCKAYAISNRRYKNKIRKLTKRYGKEKVKEMKIAHHRPDYLRRLSA